MASRSRLLLQLPLPLEGEVRRGYDQDALAEAPELEVHDEQPNHEQAMEFEE
jgi:hypothetical protein